MTVTFESTTLATPPSGTVVGSDTIGGVDYQRIKVVWGTTGTATELTTAAPFPVQVTKQSSNIAVDVGILPSVTLSSGTQTIGSVAPSSQWTVTTAPSSIISVNQGTSPWVTSVASSTTVIGAVLPSSQWTVTTTPSSIISVNQGTSPWITSIATSTTVIGSVLPSSQWTVTTTPSSITSVAASSTWTVALSSGTQVIGSVAPSSQWTVTTTPSSITSVAASSLWTVATSSTTTVQGSVIASTIWTMAAAMDVSVAMSSGTSITPQYANATSSSTLFAIVSAVTAKKIVVLAFWIDVSTTSTADITAQFTSSLGSTDQVWSAKMYFRGGTGDMQMGYCPVGYCTTATTNGLFLNTSAGVGPTGIGVNVTYVTV